MGPGFDSLRSSGRGDSIGSDFAHAIAKPLPSFADTRRISPLRSQLCPALTCSRLRSAQLDLLDREWLFRVVESGCRGIGLLLPTFGSNPANHIFEGFAVVNQRYGRTTRSYPPSLLPLLPSSFAFFQALVYGRWLFIIGKRNTHWSEAQHRKGYHCHRGTFHDAPST